MKNDEQHSLEEYKRYTKIGSSIALLATGATAITTTIPALTGALVGAALVSSGIAAYTYYKSLVVEEEKK